MGLWQLCMSQEGGADSPLFWTIFVKICGKKKE